MPKSEAGNGLVCGTCGQPRTCPTRGAPSARSTTIDHISAETRELIVSYRMLCAKLFSPKGKKEEKKISSCCPSLCQDPPPATRRGKNPPAERRRSPAVDLDVEGARGPPQEARAPNGYHGPTATRVCR